MGTQVLNDTGQDTTFTENLNVVKELATQQSLRVFRVRGAKLEILSATTTVTCSGATSSATNLIPAGSVTLGVACRVTTLITGATTFTIGDGTTADLFGTGILLTVGTTTTFANHKSTFAPKLYAAATSIVLTATGSNFTAGVVRVTLFYLNLGADAS